jgi:hypothetical protein
MLTVLTLRLTVSALVMNGRRHYSVAAQVRCADEPGNIVSRDTEPIPYQMLSP